jgi:hypothetical protein
MLETINSNLKSLVSQKQDEIISIAAKHGAHNIELMDVQDEGGIEPEIDFLTDYIVGQLSPWFPSGLKHELEGLLGSKVNIITRNSLKENK